MFNVYTNINDVFENCKYLEVYFSKSLTALLVAVSMWVSLQPSGYSSKLNVSGTTFVHPSELPLRA
jgi:hypothetical protein